MAVIIEGEDYDNNLTVHTVTVQQWENVWNIQELMEDQYQTGWVDVTGDTFEVWI